MAARPKHVQLSVWKRLILIASILPGVSFATLIPCQAAYANSSGPQTIFTCRAGDGGNGGVAIGDSTTANGAPGGDCVYGPKAGHGGPGGNHGSAGGPGGNLIL